MDADTTKDQVNAGPQSGRDTCERLPLSKHPAHELPIIHCLIKPLVSKFKRPRLRRVQSMPVRSKAGMLEETPESHGGGPDKATQPTSHWSYSESSMFSSASSATLSSLNPDACPRRQVSFASSSKGPDLVPPRSDVDYLTPDELSKQDKRIAAHDELYGILHATCLSNPDRFVPSIPERMSARRQKLIPAHSDGESLRFWEFLRDQDCVNFSPNPSREISLKVMEKMFSLVWRNAFRDLPREGCKPSAADTIDNARYLTKRLEEYFIIFEYDPFGKDHKKFHRDLFKLASSAHRLRGLLAATKKFRFRCYPPLIKKGSTRKLSLLRDKVSILETHGTSRRDDNTSDIVYMALFCCIVRYLRLVGPDRVNEKAPIVECRAVGVAWRPSRGEKISPWACKKSEEGLRAEAMLDATRLELDLRGEDDDDELQ